MQYHPEQPRKSFIVSNKDYDDRRRALKDFICSKRLWLVASGEQTLPRKPITEETRHHIENMQKAKGYNCSTLNDTVKVLVMRMMNLLQCWLHFIPS